MNYSEMKQEPQIKQICVCIHVQDLSQSESLDGVEACGEAEDQDPHGASGLFRCVCVGDGLLHMDVSQVHRLQQVQEPEELKNQPL